MKLTLAALALAVMPGLAMATCFGHEKEQTAMTCAPGTVFDEDAQNCVPTTG